MKVAQLEREWELEKQARGMAGMLPPIRLYLTKVRIHNEMVHGATLVEDYKMDAHGWHQKTHPDCSLALAEDPMVLLERWLAAEEEEEEEE